MESYLENDEDFVLEQCGTQERSGKWERAKPLKELLFSFEIHFSKSVHCTSFTIVFCVVVFTRVSQFLERFEVFCGCSCFEQRFTSSTSDKAQSYQICSYNHTVATAVWKKQQTLASTKYQPTTNQQRTKNEEQELK